MRKIDPFDLHCLIGTVCISLSVSLFLSLSTFRFHPELSPHDSFKLMLNQLSVCLLIAVICCVIGTLVYFIVRHIDHSAVKTAFALWGNRISEQLRLRNAERIAPWLRLFLFSVLTRNTETLPLPLGSDMSCLTPYGFHTAFRSDCMFYTFQLIANDFPDLTECDVQRLLNQLVVAELNNYGLVGLPALYRDVQSYMWPTVYVDRVTYDTPNHVINFDLLFISSETEVNYRRRAMVRDNPQPHVKTAVYDDEL